MFTLELKKVFEEAVTDAIEGIPVVSIGLTEQGLDLKDYIDNEMDFYLGVVIATILERYMVYAQNKGFTKQQIISTNPFAAISIFNMIPTLKEEIKSKFGL